MFDKFGEFDSAEELNLAAAGLLKEGDTTSLYELARENGIDEEDTKDYTDGMTEELVTELSAAFGRLMIEEGENEKKKTEVEKMPGRVILHMLRTMLTTPGIPAAIMKKGKRAVGIYEAMKNEAEKHKSGGMGVSCGTDRELCEIIKAYYLENDKEFRAKIAALYK